MWPRTLLEEKGEDMRRWKKEIYQTGHELIFVKNLGALHDANVDNEAASRVLANKFVMTEVHQYK